jgi:hypothetical protein
MFHKWTRAAILKRNKKKKIERGRERCKEKDKLAKSVHQFQSKGQ